MDDVKIELNDEEYLGFIMDLVEDGLVKWEEGNVEHGAGMALLACNNLVRYLRRSNQTAKEVD